MVGYHATDDGAAGGFEDPGFFDVDEDGFHDGFHDPAPMEAADGPPDWFDEFATDVASKLSELEHRYQQPVAQEASYWRDDPTYLDIDQRIAQRSDAVARAMSETMRPMLEAQIVQQVAGDLPAEAQEYVRAELQGINPMEMAAIAKNPQVARMLKFAAKGYAGERQSPRTAAPRSEGVHNPSSNLDAAAEREIASYLRAFGPRGATREMAVAAYNRAMEQGGR
ncbi:hypothetical protein OP10G_3614 [Fimbriimonas ginsengisoli Gsoil 348]|uniref:Uncharacterized protein n=1 Tax=Fimbriimonas ginsengisoli Gsoil 348 TaxID=661478 RepID=A0A068NUE7_FIMGI|nr:hypothetical protein OP10G_3614 [Fimbriimonas ginsengisoli Gsoil 348]